MMDYIVPGLLLIASIWGLRKGENSYDLLLQGGSEGLKLMAQLTPALILLLTGVTMLRESGALEILEQILGPFYQLCGIPKQTILLTLVRPFSGSAALAIGAQIMAEYGPDSTIGRTAAVMLGSTETTFYTISIYFGAAGIKKTRYAIPAALIADLTGFITAAWITKLL